MEAADAEIGEKLAKRLGITCYDKLLLKQAAQKSGVSEKEFERLDEKPVGAGQFLSGNVFADSASIGSTFYSESQIVYDAEQETILKVAEQGPCVIIGRCASVHCLRQERKTCIPVFIYADEDARIARIAPEIIWMSMKHGRACAKWTGCAAAILISMPTRSGASRKAMI